MNILDFPKRKAAGEKISMVTCYDYWTAKLLNTTEVDTLLVGDSLAMVMHGHDSTIYADVELMALHTRAVSKGAPDKFVVGDMPFLSVRKGLGYAMDSVGTLMQAGANAVKIEGEQGQLDIIAHIVESGVPVIGHLGLTPQSVEAFGGHKVQGRNEGAAGEILVSATRLAEAGVCAIVLECVPSELGRAITNAIEIPTIGIGAGAHTDGQVLVLQDMLGADPSFKPKFLRHFADARSMITSAVNAFHDETAAGTFPAPQESYS